MSESETYYEYLRAAADVLRNGYLLLAVAFALVVCGAFLGAAVSSAWRRARLLSALIYVIRAIPAPKGSPWRDKSEALVMWLKQHRDLEETHQESAATVRSPTRTYDIAFQLGRGDVSEAFYAFADGRPYVLKFERAVGCRRLLLKERTILRQLQTECVGAYADYFPAPAESFRADGQLVSGFHFCEGYCTAVEIRQRHPQGLGGRHIAWMFNRTLEALGAAHSLGWIHGAVLPPHLLFRPESHALQLISWIHAEPCGQPLRFVSREFKSWYPPECQHREAATPATDIYLAAKSMIWLAGGDARTNAPPASIPYEFRELLLDCLADDPMRRPQDAWRLHEDLREVLECAYGAPKFCHLDMT